MQVVMGGILSQASAMPPGQESRGPRVLGDAGFYIEVPDVEDYTTEEKLRLEQEAVGFTLSANEMEIYGSAPKEQSAVTSGKLGRYADREVSVVGMLAAGRKHTTKEGDPMLFMTLQDHEGLTEVVLFSDAYKENREVLASGGYGPYLVKGTVQVSGKGRGIGVQPPTYLKPADKVTIKMHPVLIASEVRLLEQEGS